MSDRGGFTIPRAFGSGAVYGELTTANVPACTTTPSCGLNAVFSNWGTYPSWSPYPAPVIEDAITTSRNNSFSHNTYSGPWRLMYHDQGTFTTPS